MEFDFCAIQLKRRRSTRSIYPSGKISSIPRVSPISEREKYHHDSMRFVSSLKVGTLCQRVKCERKGDGKAERHDGWEKNVSLEKVDCTTKLQIIRQPNLIHSYKIAYRRGGNYSSRRCIITRDNNIRLEMYRDFLG